MAEPPFPYLPNGGTYPCTACGRPIMQRGDWVAGKLVGFLRIYAPFTPVGMLYCPAQSVTASLTSTG